MESNQKDVKPNYRRIVIWTSFIVVILWALTFFMLKLDETNRGTIGDMFGMINALFSGLAFAGIILTIYMQREELALQRKELEETRGVFEKQSAIMSNQQNDTQFFNLLENHRQMVHSFDKKRNHYQRAGLGRGRGFYNKELESGYQFLSNVAESWLEYLTEYSNMQKLKTLYATNILIYDPVDVIKNDENIRSFVNETTHLSDFVQRKFGGTNDFEFYNDTLSNSLLESEKFILCAWNDIVKGDKSSSPFGLEFYNDCEFIDFNKYVLPHIEIGLHGESFKPNHFEIKSNGVLLNYFTVIDHDPERKGDTKIEVCPKGVDLVDGILSITIMDYLRESSLEIETNTVSEEKLVPLRMSNHHLVVEVMFNHTIYHVPIEFELEAREDFGRKSTDGEKFYNLTFTWTNSKSMSIEAAMQLVGTVKSSNK